jgi:hypothetical protein
MAGFAMLLASTYALMVTYSRNGYVAYAASLMLVLLAQVLRGRRFLVSLVAAAVTAGASLAVAIPIFTGDFAQARLATIQADLRTRLTHWQDALSIRDQGWMTEAFGTGLGRFPETSFWRSTTIGRAGTYGLANQNGNTFLKLGAGDSLYVEQMIQLKPGEQYKLKFDVRPMGPNSGIALPICEKWLLTSYSCIWSSFRFGKDYGEWETVELPLDVSRLKRGSWFIKRPIKLSIYYADPGAPIDVDNISILASDGSALVKNGDFSEGMDHWFFSADGHLQWHIKNLFIGLLFDQGWLGALSVSALLLLALARATRCAIGGDQHAAAVLAGLGGFIIVGIFDTLIDSPRFLMLMLVLIWFCARTCNGPRVFVANGGGVNSVQNRSGSRI